MICRQRPRRINGHHGMHMYFMSQCVWELPQSSSWFMYECMSHQCPCRNASETMVEHSQPKDCYSTLWVCHSRSNPWAAERCNLRTHGSISIAQDDITAPRSYKQGNDISEVGGWPTEKSFRFVRACAHVEFELNCVLVRFSFRSWMRCSSLARCNINLILT